MPEELKLGNGNRCSLSVLYWKVIDFIHHTSSDSNQWVKGEICKSVQVSSTAHMEKANSDHRVTHKQLQQQSRISNINNSGKAAAFFPINFPIGLAWYFSISNHVFYTKQWNSQNQYWNSNKSIPILRSQLFKAFHYWCKLMMGDMTGKKQCLLIPTSQKG